MSKKIASIRSGGQSGVDRAAMDIARQFHIPVCGWCPKHGWAEDYPTSPGLLTDYPELTETPSEGTSQRTLWNMRDADALLTIMPENSAESKGTDVGVREGIQLGKPMYTAKSVKDVPAIITWLQTLPDNLDLSVGGPRASECPDAYEVTCQILEQVIIHFSEQ